MRALMCALGVGVVMIGASCNALLGIEPASLKCAHQEGEARIRIGDFVPSTERHDVCLVRVDGSSPIDRTPLFKSIGYRELRAPIALPAGAYAMSVVPAGQSCAATPLMKTSLCIHPGTTTVVISGTPSTMQVASFSETLDTSVQAKLRFVHAIAGENNLDFGRVPKPIPQQPIAAIFSGVSYGAAGSGDTNGYASFDGQHLDLGVAQSGGASQLVKSVQIVGQHRYTAFAIGDRLDVRFPEEIVLCDETADDGVHTNCGGLTTLTFQSIESSLFGAFAPAYPARRAPIMDAIAQATADVLCLSSIPLQSDRQQLFGKTALSFPYNVNFADDLDTPISDPTDLNGQVPTAPSTPPCTQGDTRVTNALACIQANCSADMTTIDADSLLCVATKCAAQLVPLITGAPACWSCTMGELGSFSPFTQVASACATDPKDRYSFKGGSQLLMMSKRPLKEPKQWVFPSTRARDVILEAALDLPNGTTLDVYCVQTTTPGDSVYIPYTGLYGNGQTGIAAWRQELLLQMKQLVKFVHDTSNANGRRAVLTGYFNAGPPLAEADATNPDAWNVLSPVFPLAIPAGYPYTCTSCATNPLLAAAKAMPSNDAWVLHVLLDGIPVTQVTNAEVTMKDATIPYMNMMVAPSLSYAFSSTVVIPQ
jgi:hypothetical protein